MAPYPFPVLVAADSESDRRLHGGVGQKYYHMRAKIPILCVCARTTLRGCARAVSAVARPSDSCQQPVVRSLAPAEPKFRPAHDQWSRYGPIRMPDDRPTCSLLT